MIFWGFFLVFLALWFPDFEISRFRGFEVLWFYDSGLVQLSILGFWYSRELLDFHSGLHDLPRLLVDRKLKGGTKKWKQKLASTKLALRNENSLFNISFLHCRLPRCSTFLSL